MLCSNLYGFKSFNIPFNFLLFKIFYQHHNRTIQLEQKGLEMSTDQNYAAGILENFLEATMVVVICYIGNFIYIDNQLNSISIKTNLFFLRKSFHLFFNPYSCYNHCDLFRSLLLLVFVYDV